MHLNKFNLLRLTMHLASILPALILIIDAFTGNLTANPILAVEQRTGQYALITLLASLACTPIYILTGYRPIRKFRRPLGLYAFFYASVHFLTYIVLDYSLQISRILQSLTVRPFIILGSIAWLLLAFLAITSNKKSKQILAKNWKRLHRFVYLIAVIVIIHYIWGFKGNLVLPVIYGSVLLLLLLIRLPFIARRFQTSRLPDPSTRT